MTPTQELILDLKAAIANKKKHNQRVFFNECGTAACIAGQKLERDILNRVNGANENYRHRNCWEYARIAYGLSFHMGDLIFSENANYITHQLAIILLERDLESKFHSFDYIDDIIYRDDTESGYSKANFTLSIVTVKENTEDIFKLLTDITEEIGANLHKRTTFNEFIIECGVDFTCNDVETILYERERC